MSFTVSRHALDRMVEMGVQGEQVREVMLNPRLITDSALGREIRTRGKLSIVVTKQAPVTIITVMWATAAAWAADHDTIRSRGDRDQEHMNALRRARKAQRNKTRGRGYR